MIAAAVGPGTPGPAPAGTGVERMRAVVDRLAAADFGGRRVGTPGGEAAAAWLAEHLASLGATVTVDEFVLRGVVKQLAATPILRWRGVSLVHRRDFAEHLASRDTPTERTGRLANADDSDVQGAWVPAEAFAADHVAALAHAGAVGVLLPRGTDEAGWMPKMIAGRAGAAALPLVSVGSDLYQKMKSEPSVVSASVPLSTVDVLGRNVYGVFRPAPAHGLSVLLTAHFDGVGDDPGGIRFPAAADNASGVAVILEAAQQLHRTLPAGIGLSVALLDAEEAGAHGSAHHAPQVAPGTYVVNVDGAAHLHGAAAVEAGGPAMPLLQALDRAGRDTGVPLRARAMPSDNRRYAAAGLPAVGIGMGIPGYQTPAETPDRVESGTLLAASRLVVATAEQIHPA